MNEPLEGALITAIGAHSVGTHYGKPLLEDVREGGGEGCG